MSLNDYYASIVGDMGRAVSDSKEALDYQTTILDNITTRRESVSGVSIDEEMINLMKYQMGYNAAGQLAKTVSEMLDTLMKIGD
jgi:flagellar hook-associated protein 1 FlgK